MEVADLKSLVIFAKVVEAKGFSEAARRLKIPLSTVSRRVAELEDQLKVRLLDGRRAICGSPISGRRF